MRAVDTNVLVRIVVRDEPDQVAAADAFIANGAWVSHLVFTETVWVLASVYKLSQERILAAASMLLNHVHLTVEDSDVVEAALTQHQAHRSADLSDCLILEIARKAGHLPVGTFDRGLAKLKGAQKI
jgi:predicted nucleic-acid-binding protein